ncbi:MAG: DNA mismatch repair endonuclease MutL, partial [Acutalibacteraceae bacterium]
MARINVLPKSVAELIAAGEVVERPASVVKELIENSIDAGASAVTVEIKNGGITYIRITDNGCGIYRQDVQKAFISHATSKVQSADDLNSIFTLGFRGEALASVAAVSRVQMLTKSPDESEGTSYTIEGGEEISCEAAGCPDGTTIVVRDLFYNTPARMKFLKKDVSEANTVADTVDKLALSHPEISFRFIRDGKRTLLTPGDSKLISAVYAVYGKAFAEGLIETGYELDGVQVKGLVSKPEKSRASRSMQVFFLNSRYIKSRSCTASLENAYKNSIMIGKFPACVLNITVPANLVDVNVHPTKTEVRFSDERKIYSAVYYAVKSAVEADEERPQFNLNRVVERVVPKAVQLEMVEETPVVKSKPNPDFWANIKSSDYSKQSVAVASPEIENPFDKSDELPDLIGKIKKPVKSAEPIKSETTAIPQVQENSKINFSEEKHEDTFRFIGEAFKTYVICEFNDKLCLIDKHAAHERIIFNKLKRTVNENSKQVLLSPVTVTLAKNEYNIVIQNLEIFSSCGFTVEDFGKGCVIIREIPMLIDP